jgi:hypothetical protein
VNIGDLEIGDSKDEGGGSSLFGVREKMVHHEDEEERASLFRRLVLDIYVSHTFIQRLSETFCWK